MPIPTSTQKLKIVSIFRTLDGEVTKGGPLNWSTFIRFGGCNLRCWKSSGFCDAPHSLRLDYPYRQYELGEAIAAATRFKTNRFTITGGEPLLQRTGCVSLATHLPGFVSLETSGSLEITSTELNAFGCIIMDLKPPSTEMDRKNEMSNMAVLRKQDYVKFVLSDRLDFDWACWAIQTFPTQAKVAMGPRHGLLDPTDIIKWMEEKELFDVQLNLQLHKYIFKQPEPFYKTLNDVPVLTMIEREV